MEATRRASKLVGVLLALAALVLLLLWMQGVLGGHKIAPGETPLAARALAGPFETEEVRRVSYVRTEEAVGTVRAKREVLIAPRIMGTLLELPYREGDTVESGKMLARLDDRDIRARLEQARSAVASAQSEYARAQSDYERFKRLRDQEAVPQQQFEAVQAAYRAAEARLKGAQEALREAEVNMGFALITSPVTGYVVEKHMNVGDMASPGRPILTIQETGGLRLEAAVREGLAGSVEVGDVLRVRIDALQLDLTGKVEEKVPAADPMTRSFLVKVSLPQTPGLRSGMFGRLSIPTGTVTPLTVPAGAVQKVGAVETVWVIGEGTSPERRYVRTGRIYEDRVEILSGLTEGERVAVPPPAQKEVGPGQGGADLSSLKGGSRG